MLRPCGELSTFCRQVDIVEVGLAKGRGQCVPPPFTLNVRGNSGCPPGEGIKSIEWNFDLLSKIKRLPATRKELKPIMNKALDSLGYG